MPKRMSFEELLQDPITERILGRYAEEKVDILRRVRLKKGLWDGEAQRRLNRLCEHGVLVKVDRDGNEIEGGRSAPETYYKLVGEHWKTAVKCADMNKLRRQKYDKMTSRLMTTVYGLDHLDFEGDEEGETRFAEVLERLDRLALTILFLKARFLQREIGKAYDDLGDKIADPITRWVIGLYAWMKAMAPVTDVEHPELEDFVSEALSALFCVWREGGEEIDDNEGMRFLDGGEEALTMILGEHETVGSILKLIEENPLEGMVVAHVTPTIGSEEAALDRTEDMFRRFLRSEGESEMDVYLPFFHWLKKRIRSERDLKYSKDPFRTILSKRFRKAPDELRKETRKAKKESNREYLYTMFQYRLLEMPPMPTCDEVRKHWGRQRGQRSN
ncbi:MAG: hypothetical protein ACE5IJ_02180 [Thermoplasmata archaeon]